MMRDSGLKYVHATGRKPDNSQDLKNARKTLMKEGILYKENFKDSDGSMVRDIPLFYITTASFLNYNINIV
jgi:hypothetical protein